jgi:hypothetical protein
MTDYDQRMGLARRLPRLALKLALSSLLAALLFEGALRTIVHLDAAGGAFAALRDPMNFARPWDDDYWKLHHLFTRAHAPGVAWNFDPVTGWRSPRVQPRTYEHADRDQLRERRPVLLYGDSYAYCFTSDDACWQGLLEHSELGQQYALLNYGTTGFGLDQCWLLYQQSIESYAELEPVVVIAVLVDDDFDRCLLRFRDWPKPQFTLGPGGALELHPPEGEGDRVRYLAEHPLDLGCYAWKFFVHGTNVLGPSLRNRFTYQSAAIKLAEQLCSRILLEWKQDLDRRGLQYFVLLFHNREHLESQGASGWREPFAVTELTKLGIPFVSSKVRLLADARANARASADYYLATGPGVLHFNALGNAVVFDCFLAGLERRFDSVETTRSIQPAPQARR